MSDAPKRRTFRKFTFRGGDLEKLMDLDSTQIMDLMHARVRRRFARGLKRKPMGLIKRLRKVSLPCPPPSHCCLYRACCPAAVGRWVAGYTGLVSDMRCYRTGENPCDSG